ncbi:DUF6912 family protein [Luteococcus peritonei]|uniref:DUF6912 family protein n=1 Tax=Luteococcus peritonei TaxID=88874 RepID=A0ABW4RRT1_9ACTN
MKRTLVLVPVSTEQARALWRAEDLGELQAFSVTDELLANLEGVHDAEDAEHACAQLASLWGLSHHGERLVLAAEVDPGVLRPEQNEAHNGGVLLGRLTRAQVSAFFADDPANPLPQGLSQQVAGLDVDQAWELDEVQRMLRSHDLLWHSVEELAVLGEDG